MIYDGKECVFGPSYLDETIKYIKNNIKPCSMWTDSVEDEFENDSVYGKKANESYYMDLDDAIGILNENGYICK